MKKTLITLSAIAALLLASCSTAAGSSGDDSAEEVKPAENNELTDNTKKDTDNEATNTDTEAEPELYTLTIVNVPFELLATYNEEDGRWYSNSNFEMNGKIYTRIFCSSQVKKETKIKTKSYVLPDLPYSYQLNVFSDQTKTYDVAKVDVVADYKFNHYTTKLANNGFYDIGISYYPGDTIELTKDTTLYCFYREVIEDNNSSNETDINAGSIDNKIVGTWKLTESNYSGTLTLKADSTGHFVSYLVGTTTHDFDFTWWVEREDDSDTKLSLHFYGTKPHDNNEGNHHIKMSSDFSSMTFSEYFSFGMPYTTVWKKQ